jgi:hypothetical protein
VHISCPDFLQMSYFESNSDGKCHGTVYLKDILSVQEAEPQVVPMLKPGEGSFFFDVSPQLHTFQPAQLQAKSYMRVVQAPTRLRSCTLTFMKLMT